jgi:3-hydroxyisobutyrate dehydrogenase
MARIAFIGLGNMGLPMARNLVKAGHEVFGADLMQAHLDAAAADGITPIADPAAVLPQVEAVVTMLPAGKQVQGVYLGESGLIARLAAGTLFIDSSTIDVESARSVASAATDAGHAMVDAPVSGGTGGATAGTLTFMVGGETSAFERALPLLSCMGKTIVHAGGAGTGQAAKICNNMVLGISMIAVSEAFALADKLGLERQKLFDISSKSSGQCWSLTSYCPVPGPVPTSPANRDYQPGFAAAMMLKDLVLAQRAAKSAGVTTALGAVSAELYTRFVADGGGDLDFSGIFKMLSHD